MRLQVIVGLTAVALTVPALTLPGVASTMPAASSTLVTVDVPSRCVDPAHVVMAEPPPGKPVRPPRLRANVLLPKGYDGERRFPVLYLLTGAGAYDYWLDFSYGELTKAVKDLPAIVVMPESGLVGAQANSWNGGRREPCWEHYALDELIPAIEGRFRVRRGRRWHAVGGFSNGGTGAINWAAKKPGYFGQALSLSGVLSIQRPEVEHEAFLVILAIFSPDKITEVGLSPYRDAYGDPSAQEYYWAGHNPVKLAPALAHTRVYIAHGGPTAPTCVDPAQAQYHCAAQEVLGGATEATLNRSYATEFMAAARVAGVPFTYRPQTGGHWYGYAARVLADAIENWGLFAPVPEHPTSWTYKTVSMTGEMWDLRFAFAQPPQTLETFTRAGSRLLGDGTGTVHLQNAKGCELDATLPFDLELPIGGMCSAMTSGPAVRAGA
jgi:S-formylglutathione hydrolase FrmB